MIDTNYQLDYLTALLQRSEQRHRVLSENIANLNTPGYHSRDVSFEDLLKRIQSGASLTESGETQAKASYVAGLNERPDGNNVNIELELSKMTKNSMNYETFSQIVASKLSIMRSAITGR